MSSLHKLPRWLMMKRGIGHVPLELIRASNEVPGLNNSMFIVKVLVRYSL